jgi:hypothetical protein
MSEQKHTPGPWVIRPNDDTQWEVTSVATVYQTSNNTRVSIIGCPKDISGDLSYPDTNTTDANVCLIAAAPDLLEACQAVAAKLDYLQQLWGKEGVTEGVAQKLQAAIAKATNPEGK